MAATLVCPMLIRGISRETRGFMPVRIGSLPIRHVGRWGKMWFGQPLAISKGAEKKKLGEDGGCFAAALESVRSFGGVLEHPEGSRAWGVFGLKLPLPAKADGFGRICAAE